MHYYIAGLSDLSRKEGWRKKLGEKNPVTSALTLYHSGIGQPLIVFGLPDRKVGQSNFLKKSLTLSSLSHTSLLSLPSEIIINC